VDLIKPCEQMRDETESNQKAFSAKTAVNVLSSQPPVTVHDKLAHAGNQHLIGVKKTSKDPNSSRKKSNASSKSRGKPLQASRERDKYKRSATIEELQSFVRQLIDNAFDIAVADQAARSQE